ncbi:MAG: PorT family protein [Bacteroidales bacterium]|nr:PorT family protein [Bacteroidales bacterium]
MKKTLIVLCILFMCTFQLKAQSGFGIKGGLSYNSMSDIELSNLYGSLKRKTGFHAGILYKVKLPVGLALQPELIYIQKGSSIEIHPDGILSKEADFKMHYVQLPVNLQWGLDLVLFRPFIMVSPYIGYAIAKGDEFQNIEWKDLNRFEYGIGLGAGMDVWRFQVTGRYCWDLGKIGDFEWAGIDTFKGGKNKGFELSLAFIF